MLRKNVAFHKSNHRRCSIKEAISKYFLVFTGKHQYWSLFLRKLQVQRPPPPPPPPIPPAKKPRTSFSAVPPTDIGIRPKNFLT